MNKTVIEAVKYDNKIKDGCEKCVFNGEPCGADIDFVIEALKLPNCDDGYYYILGLEA